MGLDVWFSEDAARIVRAAGTAGDAAAGELEPTAEALAWLRGYRAALSVVAAAFGVTMDGFPEGRLRSAVPGPGGHQVDAGEVMIFPALAAAGDRR